MATWKKLYERIKRNPRHVGFEELDSLLTRAGFQARWPSGGSSHCTYTKGSKAITVPYRRPHVREHYVKEALSLLQDELEG